MNWQPIETAPKDGTAILGFQPEGEWHDYVIASMEWMGEYWYLDKTCWPDESYQVNPTHWMPLPNPPK